MGLINNNDRGRRYYIRDLDVPQDTIIKVVCFYDNSVDYEGELKDCPSYLLNMPMRIFTPYEKKGYLEFIY